MRTSMSARTLSETQRIEAVLRVFIRPVAEMALIALLAMKERAGAAWPDESERTLKFVKRLAPKRKDTDVD